MTLPQVKGLEVIELHDFGGCGRVYRALQEGGGMVALKCLDDLSVNRGLLQKMTQRLWQDGWPHGVMPVIADQLHHSPLYQVMPWMADEQDGRWVPFSLQHVIDRHPAQDPWPLIISLAAVLASMHKHHVPHGNLKPGNVFDDGQGQVMVSDWCLGNMPGVHVFHFTDALLYQAPEQLLDASGYLDEQGYGWDVYAFGVLAFRLLTGRFPRCNEVFQKVAPPQGATRCDHLRADPDKIAANLVKSPLEPWPKEAAGEMERRMREWILRCLELDPAQRPLTMMEVSSGFDLIGKEVAELDAHRRLVDLNRKLRRRVSALALALGLALLAAGVTTVFWRHAVQRIGADRAAHAAEVEQLQADANAARAAESVAERDAEEARKILLDEREGHLSRLEASRELADQLFGWSMENGRQQLPSLDGRTQRLKRLERYYEQFIQEADKNPDLAVERARALLQLAEISIASADVQRALERFAAAQEAWAGVPKDAEMWMRLATDRLLIAMLRDSKSDEGALQAYADARTALERVPRQQVSADRLDQLSAVIDFREARLLMATGKNGKALEQLMRATKTLNRLSMQRPDVALLRSALADCYLSSAVVLDGLGSLGDAREVRLLALDLLTALHKEKPADLDIHFDLAACYTTMAEAAVLSGDIEGARQRSEQASNLFRDYLKQRPRDDEATIRKAVLLGLQAGLDRDQGKVTQAAAAYDEAMQLLEAVHDRSPANSLASYHLALTWWQKGRMPATQKDGGDITLMLKAGGLLEELGKQPAEGGPTSEQLLRSRAYLAGDLAFSFSAKRQQDKAALAYRDAIQLWQQLLKLRPQSEEYQQALDWCRESQQSAK